MDVIINYTRLTTSDRLADRFLTCQVYSPHEEESKEKGSIYSQVEILNPWFTASQVGQSIINTLIRDYYKADDTSDLNNFETAIKGVNGSLAQIAQGGETDWIGRLSSVLILINGKEAHFAQTGQSYAYLYRSNQINHITEGLENEMSPHPLKTFTNLTSGTLQEGDKIIIANPTFFEVIDPSELKTIITQNDPTRAAIESGKILKGRGIKYANAIFMEVTTKDALANLTPDQKRDVIYINEQLSSLSVNLKNIWRNLVVPLVVSIGNFSTKAFSKTKKSLTPKIKEGISRTAENSKKIMEFAKSKSSDLVKQSKIKTEKEKEVIVPDKKTDLPQSFKLLLLKTKNKFKRFLLKVGFSKPHGPRMYLIGLLVAILILAITIGFSTLSKNRKANSKDMQEMLNQITSLEGEASTLIAQNNDEQALMNYKKIIELTEQLKNGKYSAQADKSYESAFLKILEITKAQEIKDFEEKELPMKPFLFALTDSDLYLISKEYNFYNPKNNKEINLSGKIEGEISHATAIGEKIATSTKDGTLYIIEPATETADKQLLKLNYDGILKSFLENLYVLDPPSNQIWKVINDSGYKDNTPYLADESLSIADVISIAIDGSVYTINHSCTINRLSRGSSVSNFTVNLPANDKLESCLDIYTSENSENLYILGKSDNLVKIIELGKNGTFIGQYILKDTRCDSNCFIDSNERIFYKIEDNKLKSAKF